MSRARAIQSTNQSITSRGPVAGAGQPPPGCSDGGEADPTRIIRCRRPARSRALNGGKPWGEGGERGGNLSRSYQIMAWKPEPELRAKDAGAAPPGREPRIAPGPGAGAWGSAALGQQRKGGRNDKDVRGSRRITIRGTGFKIRCPFSQRPSGKSASSPVQRGSDRREPIFFSPLLP